MIELSYLKEYEKIRYLPKEVQETIQGILQILDTEYGADRKKYEDDGVLLLLFCLQLGFSYLLNLFVIIFKI